MVWSSDIATADLLTSWSQDFSLCIEPPRAEGRVRHSHYRAAAGAGRWTGGDAVWTPPSRIVHGDVMGAAVKPALAFALLLLAPAARAKDEQPCPRVRFVGPSVRLSKMEKRLVCGDP